jgi:Domain of unknown function (DUF1851)
MQLEKSHLMADVALEDVRAALSAWSWLLEDGRWSPLLVGAAGDVFLASPAGVFRLDTGVGELERIAENESMFQRSLHDPALVHDWFLEPVIDELRANGTKLRPGQCYSYAILPVFEQGSYKAENRFALPVVEHLRVTGEIHLQVKGLTDGGRVRIKVSE